MQNRMPTLRMSWKFSASLLSTAIVSLVLFVGFNLAEASDVACGDTIMGNTTLHQNLNDCGEVGLIIGADDIVLDCAGHTINGTGIDESNGVRLSDRSGVTVKNCNVVNFFDGFRLNFSDANILADNTARGSVRIGFLLISSDLNNLTGNSAVTNAGGGYILGDGSDNNTVTNNTANKNSDTAFGVNDSSDHNVFIYNTANSNVGGWDMINSEHNILIWNTSNHNSTGGFGLNGASNNYFNGNTVNHNGGPGFHLFFVSEGNIFTGNRACHNFFEDLLDVGTGTTGNHYLDNNFCTSFVLP